jgi:hypothetical protein
MAVTRNALDPSKFNATAELPYELRLDDIRAAVQDVYDFFHDVNNSLMTKGLERLDDTLRPAIMSGMLSDMLTASVAKHSRALAVDSTTEPARQRRPMTFTEIYLGRVTVADFRRNERGELGTRTATLHAEGIAKLRRSWIYRA